MSRTDYQLNIEMMMKSYVDMRENVVYDDECDGPCCRFCSDPLTKHSLFVRLAGCEPSWAKKEDVDETLTELAWILEANRSINYIEVANCFSIACQSMVAQFDSEHPRSGVSCFKHTRDIRMCSICLNALQDKIRRFREYYPGIIQFLSF